MKKAFLSALLIAGMGSIFSSCNNGDYDADPETTGGTALNPLNPSSGVTIPLGYLRAEFGGSLADFVSGNWVDAGGGLMSLSAVRIDNDHQWQTVSISLTNYTGPGTYTIYPDGSTGSIEHVLFDPATVSYIPLGYSTNVGDGSGTVTIDGNEDNNLRGTFSGTLVQKYDQINTANKEVVTNGKFYVSKLAVP